MVLHRSQLARHSAALPSSKRSSLTKLKKSTIGRNKVNPHIGFGRACAIPKAVLFALLR
ncbi:hypothetical protein BN2476_60024 [Paraburkholderia piptadeniae]|uniref:Uncharacterized protein n=1 Tax=Paraburkholderia piptadeniae TaxID=1701573 RepID=A0A1N7RKY0_9BURK|nr:hypothetical protein BN2476_60024 [Paraburkholderia piptadeniae]